ncbi:MAG: coproporphyrinogen-III oxidase family protein [Novosphingobium sp.]|uniref:coproporphyrinogen-III oxidase family protein n=1 Tax=Novosphingobium sp. TaxID=1874826 RepID=UPI00301ABC02
MQRPRDDIANSLATEAFKGDYIYMYPPRQAYRPTDGAALAERIRASLQASNMLNLYLHFPFCRQICSFCNLYTNGSVRDEEVARYLAALEAEIAYWATQVERPEIRTIYFGGGTPSLLPAAALGRVLDAVSRHFGCTLSDIPEVALEVSPETVTAEGYRALRAVGFNRVNLGVQTLADDELAKFGRAYGGAVAGQSVEDALAAGFDNVCVDLIFGLAGQSDASWLASLEAVLAMRPQTICTYALTTRPQTGYAAKGYLELDPALLYRRYDMARALLRKRGYMAENHVRYIATAAGGYRQKANHWAGENVLGLGAGARSYLRDCDFQNGYSLHRRRKILADYIESVEKGESPITAGYIIDEDERRRKRVLLGLFALDRARYREEFSSDPRVDFAAEFDRLERDGLVEIGEDIIRLTERGARFRENIVPLFFSKAAVAQSSGYAYQQ